jgi:hypothetical protein
MTKAYLLKTPPQDFHAGCVVFLIADPRVYETELLSNPTKNNYNLSCCRGHSRLGYSFWASNGKRTFLDNFTCLVCLDLYCEVYFGAYLHFILHIEYTNKVNLEGAHLALKKPEYECTGLRQASHIRFNLQSWIER